MAARALSCVMFTSFGAVVCAERDGENQDLFAAAAAGLGLCGIVVEVRTFHLFSLALRLNNDLGDAGVRRGEKL